ncbi:hypothetical protein JTB14_000876 [Gonioctena quinquepunctata]|nr:hypothetical protein JTB14_000876 [Gonioctena quinquepunctata]
MDDNRCEVCKLDIDPDSADVVCCDSCRAYFHFSSDKRKNCSFVSSTERRALALQNCSLIFFCKTCREAFKNVPKFDSLKSEIANLEDEIAELRNDRAETNLEEIFSEVNERMARANNIMLYNAEESKAPLSTVRINDDKTVFSAVCANLDITIENIVEITRVCRKCNKPRPLKVTLNNTNNVHRLLRASFKLKNSHHKTTADRSPNMIKKFKMVQHNSNKMLAFFESFWDLNFKGSEGYHRCPHRFRRQPTCRSERRPLDSKNQNFDNLEFLVIVHGTADRLKVVSESLTYIRDSSNEFAIDI